jgi:hypothetical protein
MLTLMLWAPGAGFAAGPSQDEIEAVRVELPKKSVTIESKSAESVTTNTGDRFAVSKQTIIVGLDGRQVSIRKFLVPCDAVVTYSSSRDLSYPLAQMIRVKSVASDADWRYKAIAPE